MKHSKVNTTVNVPQDNEFLYIGTNEQAAKLAPLKGLEPPIFLTDVYPGYFCKQFCDGDKRWGIISVNVKQLLTEMMAPYPAWLTKNIKSNNPSIANHKSKWNKSLINCGVCVYTAHIPSHAIHKIMIYTPVGRDTNIAINNLVDELPPPNLISPKEHKALYRKSLGVLRWFAGEPVRGEDIFNGTMNGKIDDKLSNRFGLDLYYIKPEERGRKNAKSE
jgi:hypothetical protein